MLTIIEAEIDVNGTVTLLEPLTLTQKSRAIITLLENGQGPKPLPTEEETRVAEARFARWIGAVNSGNPRSADNEQIDADLAREYASESAPFQRTPLDTRERRAALDELMRFAGAVSSGNPRAADNEAIDADLAREYGNEI